MIEKLTSEPNSLKLIELGSTPEQFKDLEIAKMDSLFNKFFIEEAFVVAWLDYKVLIGSYKNGVFNFCKGETFDYKYIQKLRIFDYQKELLIWRSNGKWHGRVRHDELTGKGVSAVVAEQVLYGTTATPIDNEQFTEISEKRGTRLNIPFTNIKVDDNHNRIFIKTHNYIKFNAIHQASYFDCRFVGFTDGEKAL